MKNPTFCLAALLAAGLPPAVTAADSDPAQLVQQHCTGCHDSGVYTRENRRVTTKVALENQVRRCETNLNLKWFEDDILAVTEYLDTNYYRFE